MATVLVVEDEFGIAELLDAVLTEEGYQVVTAMNGRDGLELLARERPVLVLSDYMMPVMDGAAMLARIRADPALQGIPVVMMSSMPEAAVVQRCAGYTASSASRLSCSSCWTWLGGYLEKVTAWHLDADGRRADRLSVAQLLKNYSQGLTGSGHLGFASCKSWPRPVRLTTVDRAGPECPEILDRE